VGGAYRWEWRRPNGTVPPEHPDAAAVTLALSETAGKTMLTLTVRYESQEARDGALKTGMQHGVAEGYDQLAELLASPAARRCEFRGVRVGGAGGFACPD
jgi:uncharacterized protein YndB with AHSA1/START domain